MFNFGGFEIGRYITSNVEDPYQAALRPSAPYQRSHNRSKEAWRKVADSNSGEEWIVPGEKPLRYARVRTGHEKPGKSRNNLLFLAGDTAAMVTYCVTKMITTCSTMIGQFF